MPSGRRTGVTLSIANGATESSTLKLGDDALVGVATPAALDGTALAVEGRTRIHGRSWSPWLPVVGADGAAVTVPTTGNQLVWLDPVLTLAAEEIRLVADTTQTAARDLTVLHADII